MSPGINREILKDQYRENDKLREQIGRHQQELTRLRRALDRIRNTPVALNCPTCFSMYEIAERALKDRSQNEEGP